MASPLDGRSAMLRIKDQHGTESEIRVQIVYMIEKARDPGLSVAWDVSLVFMFDDPARPDLLGRLGIDKLDDRFRLLLSNSPRA